MGSVRKFGYDTRSGSNGKENDIRTPQQLQCSEWRYDNDIYRRYKEENIGIAIKETKNGDSEKKNFGNIEETVFKGKESENYFGENEKSNVEEGCSGELFEREGEDRLSRTVKKEKRNGRAEKNSFIDEIVRELCGWNETDGIAQDYWNILRLHKEEQVTVVEYEGGCHIFKGEIDLCIGGSPCKGISRLNKNQEGLEHAESKLFWEYIRLLEEVKPKYFLLENTHGNKKATEIITETLGVKPISINSKLVSAQNRPRYYWTNIPGIKQPKDKGITTADVFDYSGDLADECRVKWLTSESGKKSVENGYTRVNPYPKSGCLTANGHRKWNENYLLKDGVYRYLSQTEIEKLQTLPIGYTKTLSYDEAYDCIGDAWTVDIIAHILSFAEWS